MPDQLRGMDLTTSTRSVISLMPTLSCHTARRSTCRASTVQCSVHACFIRRTGLDSHPRVHVQRDRHVRDFSRTSGPSMADVVRQSLSLLKASMPPEEKLDWVSASGKPLLSVCHIARCRPRQDVSCRLTESGTATLRMCRSCRLNRRWPNVPRAAADARTPRSKFTAPDSTAWDPLSHCHSRQ